jgi:hypothetical protein
MEDDLKILKVEFLKGLKWKWPQLLYFKLLIIIKQQGLMINCIYRMDDNLKLLKAE